MGCYTTLLNSDKMKLNRTYLSPFLIHFFQKIRRVIIENQKIRKFLINILSSLLKPCYNKINLKKNMQNSHFNENM